jgi:hypothetical protein
MLSTGTNENNGLASIRRNLCFSCHHYVTRQPKFRGARLSRFIDGQEGKPPLVVALPAEPERDTRRMPGECPGQDLAGDHACGLRPSARVLPRLLPACASMRFEIFPGPRCRAPGIGCGQQGQTGAENLNLG